MKRRHLRLLAPPVDDGTEEVTRALDDALDAFDRVAWSAVTACEDDETRTKIHALRFVQFAVAQAVASLDAHEIERVTTLTARLSGGASGTGSIVGALARRALKVLQMHPVPRPGGPTTAAETRWLLTICDARFVEVDDATIATALDRVRRGKSAVGALALLVHDCGAFGLAGLPHRQVHQRLEKWAPRRK